MCVKNEEHEGFLLNFSHSIKINVFISITFYLFMLLYIYSLAYIYPQYWFWQIKSMTDFFYGQNVHIDKKPSTCKAAVCNISLKIISLLL